MSATDSPDWASVLEALYNEQRPKIDASTKSHLDTIFVSTHEPLLQTMDMDEEEMNKALTYMYYSGLISKGVGNEMVLTPRGFSVAHERKLRQWRERRESERIDHRETREDRRAKEQQKVNTAIAILTIGLVTVTVLDSAVRAFVGTGESGAAFAVVGIGFAALLVYVLVIGWYGLIPQNFDS